MRCVIWKSGLVNRNDRWVLLWGGVKVEIEDLIIFDLELLLIFPFLFSIPFATKYTFLSGCNFLILLGLDFFYELYNEIINSNNNGCWFTVSYGYTYSEVGGRLHFLTFFSSSNLIFLPQHLDGYAGHPRRIYDYPSSFYKLHYLESSGTSAVTITWGIFTSCIIN